MQNTLENQDSSDPVSDIPEIGRLSAGDKVLVGIMILLVMFVLKYAASIFMPLTLAVLLSLLLSPLVFFLSRIRLPKRISAAIVVLIITGLLAGSLIVLLGPAGQWLEKAPESLQKIENKLQKVKLPIKQVQEAAEKVDDLTEIDDQSQGVHVKLQAQKLSDMVFLATPKLLAFLVLLIILVYFLLFSGEEVAKYLVQLISSLGRRQCTLDMGHSIQQEISRYLFTITTINICLGIVMAAAMAIIDMPNPLLWGAMAAVFNFAPYIGAILGTLIIAAVSFISFEEISRIVLAPGVFLMLTSMEGHFITPQILGHRFSLNPLLIFLSMILWGWMWGYVGALLAVPLLVIFKIICQSVDTLQPIAEFLAGTEKVEEQPEQEALAVSPE
ncbi:MAG: AI-2E family transporter [Desulfobulbaceae bacterium]|nr:AI-2E family transporter [Desulfobulbaceae bacterium]